MGNFNTDDELIQILEAGHNVVTPLPYQNAPLFREGVHRAARAACAHGSATFHAPASTPT